MSKPAILCVDDQRDVLAALMRDLEPFKEAFSLIACESTAEAREELDAIEAAGDLAALLICDHVMPNETGVDFLAAITATGRFPHTRKILLTGLATHEDTIAAINTGGIHYYVAKPWDREFLRQTVREQLTHALLPAGVDYQEYIRYLDQPTLYSLLREQT